MKKVLFVIHTLGNGGAERSLVNLFYELPQDRYEIDLLLFKNSGIFLKQIPSHVNVLEQPNALKKLFSPIKEAGPYAVIKLVGTAVSMVCERKTGAQKAFRWKYFYRHFIEKLDRHYDVAIGYLGGETTDYILEFVEAPKKIHWVHNDYRKCGMSRKYDLKVFSKVDAIVTVSEECLNILRDEFPDHKDKCYNIANITSSSIVEFHAKEFYPDEYRNVQALKLLSVGRLHEQKGFDMAIRASKIMKDAGKAFQWFIMGAGALEASLKAQIHEADVADCVQLIGVRENPYPYIKNCDIFVQPSRFEGKSVVLDEAKILAKPIITTNYPTVRDQLNDQEGLVVEMSPDAIAAGIMSLTPERQKMYSDYLAEREYGNLDELCKYEELLG